MNRRSIEHVCHLPRSEFGNFNLEQTLRSLSCRRRGDHSVEESDRSDLDGLPRLRVRWAIGVFECGVT